MKPGIHSMTMAEYLALKALSSGLCNVLLNQSPAHAKHEQDCIADDESSEIADVGTAIHDALLEGVDRIASINPEDYPGQKGRIPIGWTNKAIKAARDAAKAAGKIPMLSHNVMKITTAVAAATGFVEQSELAGIFQRGKPEQTIIWKEGNALCKARPDWLTDDKQGTMLHVKTTTGSANPAAWIRSHLSTDGYDVAAMFYERGLYKHRVFAGGAAIANNVFLVIEQLPPHGCSLVGLTPALADLAARKVERAIAIWQECHKTGHFPCYSPQIAYADPLPWQQAQWEEQEAIRAYERGPRVDTTPYGEQA